MSRDSELKIRLAIRLDVCSITLHFIHLTHSFNSCFHCSFSHVLGRSLSTKFITRKYLSTISGAFIRKDPHLSRVHATKR